jgi:hypothetical protein
MNAVQLNKTPEIWALLEEAAGHNSQVLGVVENFNLSFHKKKIFFNSKAKLPNFLKFSPFDTMDKKRSDVVTSAFPDIIISCGRKLAPIAVAIKKLAKKQQKNVLIVQILWPGLMFRKFDMVFTPSHDNIPWPFKNSKKIHRILGAPNRINKEFLLQEYRIWSRTIGELPSPKIAILLGGTSKKGKFTISHAKELVEKVTLLASDLKASILVTNSRRTDENVSNYIEENLKQKIGRYFYFHDVVKNKANPYYAYLQIADIVIVTGDSISMCSEAVSTGKQVFIYSPEGNAPKKHQKFHKNLIDQGFAKSFDDASLKALIKKGVNREERAKNLNTAKIIADEILKKFEQFQ